MFGPDVPASVTTSELAKLVKGIRFIEKIMANPVDKNEMAEELIPMREIFSKSVVTTMALPRGTVLRRKHLVAKKPGTGIPAERLTEVIGRRLHKRVPASHILREEDLEEA
jgi:N-acetylneuraminate synthase